MTLGKDYTFADLLKSLPFLALVYKIVEFCKKTFVFLQAFFLNNLRTLGIGQLNKLFPEKLTLVSCYLIFTCLEAAINSYKFLFSRSLLTNFHRSRDPNLEIVYYLNEHNTYSYRGEDNFDGFTSIFSILNCNWRNWVSDSQYFDPTSDELLEDTTDAICVAVYGSHYPTYLHRRDILFYAKFRLVRNV